MSVPIVPVPGLNEAIEKHLEQQKALEVGRFEPAPLVPKWLAALAAAAVPVLAAANGFLPHPFSAYAAILGGVAAFLGCVALPQFRFGQPLIPLTLVPVALSVGGWLATFAQTLTSPVAQGLATLGAFILFGVAGKTLPAPTK